MLVKCRGGSRRAQIFFDAGKEGAEKIWDEFRCGVVVELRGIEPLAYALRTRRSPS